MNPDLLHFLDRAIQWLILPLIAFWWSAYRTFSTQLADHDRALLKLATMLDERAMHRSEERKEEAKAMNDLRELFRDLRAEIKELRAEIAAMRNHT